MKGLEPSTFCMASVLRQRTGAKGARDDVGRGNRPRIFPFFPVACYHGVTSGTSSCFLSGTIFAEAIPGFSEYALMPTAFGFPGGLS
jgi:hypothetical protein